MHTASATTHGTDSSLATSDMLHIGGLSGSSSPLVVNLMPGSPTLNPEPFPVSTPSPVSATLASLDRLSAESGASDRGLLAASLGAGSVANPAATLQAMVGSDTLTVAQASQVFSQVFSHMSTTDVVAAIRTSGLSGGGDVAALLSRVIGGEKMSVAEFQRILSERGVSANAAKVYVAAFQRIHSGTAVPRTIAVPRR